MTKYLNFFESESGFTEAVEAGELFYPNVSYTENDDTVHWNLGRSVKTPMLRMSFSTSTPGQEVKLTRYSDSNVTAMEIDGIPVNVSGDTYRIAEPGNHTAVYQFASPAIPERLFWAESGAFDTFTSAEITTAVTAVGYSAFVGCRGLSGVTIPDSVTTISAQAFVNSGLRSVTIPDSVTTLGGYPFFHCTELRTATVGGGVTAILNQTFGECTSLQSVALPDGLKFIGYEVFINCHSLRDINIPSGVTTIDERAFVGCTGLTAIYLNPETPPSLGNNALLDTNDCPIYVPAEAVETYKQAWPSYAYRIKTKHRISASVNDEDKGEVMLGQETASEGETVGFNVIVFEESRPYQVSVTDGNGNNVQVTDEGDNSYSFTMPASDVTILVTIGEKPKYNITASVNDDSLGQVNLEQETASEGDHVEFDVEVSDMMQHQVTSVAVTDGNGNEVECNEDWDNHYSFDMPASDVTISVTIGEKQKYNITASVNDDSLGQVNVQETASEYETVFIDVSVNDGCRVASLVITDAGGNEVEHTGEHTDFELGHYGCYFDMPASDVTIFATLEEKPIGQYHISVDLNDGSQGEVSLFKETAQETANEGDTVRLKVNVFDPENYRVGLVRVTDGNGDKVQVTNEHYDNYYHFTMPASDVTIRVVMVMIEPKQ